MNYRQLKTKGVLATKTAVRAFLGNILCYLPYIGWVPKPSRKNGISVMVRTRNEEEWIELSLFSIKDLADEIVGVNNIPYFKIGKVMVRKLELTPNV